MALLKKVIGCWILGWIGVACASVNGSRALEVRQESYSAIPSERIIEAPYEHVWRAIDEVFRKYAVSEVDPESVSTPKEWNALKERTLKTDWIFMRSDEWYSTYLVNQSPRRTYLQLKAKIIVQTEPAPGGVRVRVSVDEQIQPIDEFGRPLEFTSSPAPSRRLAGLFLEKVAQKVLSVPASDLRALQ